MTTLLRRFTGRLPAVLLAIAGAGPAVAAPATTAGLVTAIELRADVPPQRVPELRQFLAFTVGEPLTPEVVRRTLRNLQASGLASRVEIRQRPHRGGVEAVVSVWSNFMLEEVDLVGEFGVFKRKDLRAALPLRAGEPLLEDRVLRGDFRLEELLESRGYLSARVSLRVEVDEGNHRATVTYTVEPGPRASIGSVSFEGDMGPFAPDELTARLRARPGEPYQQTQVRDDAERLRTWLVGQGHRSARVELRDESRSAAEARVDLAYRVAVGPRVEIVVEGAREQRLEKRGLLPFLGPEGFDEALLLLAVDQIRTHLQGRGHYRATVDVEQEDLTREGEEVLRVTLTVDPGPVFSLREVRLEGNEEVSDGELAERMETSAGGVLGLRKGRLVDEVLAADLANLRSFYALQGFSGTRVGPPEVEVEARDLILTLPIEEGTRRRVTALRLEGVSAFDHEEVRRSLPLAEGGGYHPSLLQDSLDILRARYAALGHGEARVSASLRWNPESTEVEVTVQVFEGPRQVLDRIVVIGNRITETPVVLRALEVAPGDPISRARLLEMERNLTRLGLFSQVDLELIRTDLGATQRDVVVRVEEGPTRFMSYQIGYDSEDRLRGQVGFSLRNVGGRGHVLRSDLRLSENDSRFRLLFDQPWLRGWPFGMAYEGFLLEEDQESYQARRLIGRTEGRRELDRLGTSRREAPRNRFTLSYDYRRIEIIDLADALVVGSTEDGKPIARPGVLSPLEEEEGVPVPVEVSSLVPGFVVDRRDDPLEPTRGWTSAAQLEWAFPVAGAEADHLKLFARHSQYFDLGAPGILATSFRLGAIEPLADVAGAEDDPALAVPLDERFFAGGRITHRAFPRLGLGIPGETLVVEGDARESIGGNGLALLNLELRFPLFGPVGGLVFYDAGNVWRDWRDISLDGLRHGAGLGLRYLSPIGPLRIEGAWKLDREPGESSFELHFSFGNPF